MLVAGTFLLSLLAAPDLAPPVVWSGGDSKITAARTELVTREWDWIRVWYQHKGLGKRFVEWESTTKAHPELRRYDYYNKTGMPEIDFRTHVVVAIFGGAQHNTAGYSVLETKLEGDTLVLRVLPRNYSTVVVVPPGRSVSSHLSKLPPPNDRPFGFVLLPRTGRTLRLEEGIVERKGEPVTKFRPLKTFRIPTG